MDKPEWVKKGPSALGGVFEGPIIRPFTRIYRVELPIGKTPYSRCWLRPYSGRVPGKTQAEFWNIFIAVMPQSKMIFNVSPMKY
jgi:hypothetical protein